MADIIKATLQVGGGGGHGPSWWRWWTWSLLVTMTSLMTTQVNRFPVRSSCRTSFQRDWVVEPVAREEDSD